MKTLIAYATKYGSVEKCAIMLSERLTGKVDQINLKETKNVDLSPYDHVIIGGSIYMGRIQKEVSGFCAKNRDILKEKNIGVYICCMRDGDDAEKQLYAAFPHEVLTNTLACDYLGGSFTFNKMSVIDRFIVKKVSKMDKDMYNISELKIGKFAKSMNNGR